MPLFIFDVRYSAADLTDGLAGCPTHILARLAADSVFHADPVIRPGRNGRLAHRGQEVHCLEAADFAAPADTRPSGRRPEPCRR